MTTPKRQRARRRGASTAGRSALIALAMASLICSVVVAGPQRAAAATGPYAVQASIPVGGEPSSIAVDASTGEVYVSNSADGDVSVIDESTNTVLTTIDVGGDPAGIAVDEDTGLVFVTDFDRSLLDVIDTESNSLIGTVPVGLGADGVAVDEATGMVFVANSNDNTVSVLNESTGEVTHTIPVGVYPTDVAVDETTGDVYVTNSGNVDDTISVISTKTWTVPATISVTGIPQWIAFDPDTGTIYATAHVNGQPTDNVLAIDAEDNSVTGTAVVPSDGGQIAVDYSTDTVVVGDYVISGATNALIATLNVEYEGPVGIDPYTNLVYVGSDQIPGTVTAFSEPVSIDSWIPTATLTVGDPYSMTFTARGPAPVTFAVSYGQLPDGLSLNPSTGLASGTPDALGTYLYGITATDADGDAVTQYYQQSVQPVVSRVSGADRYATAVAVSQREFPGTASVVYVASGLNYPDALSAGPAAVAAGGPLLLTATNSLPSSVATEISRLKPSRIVVVGGPGAVSQSVVEALTALLPAGGTITRYSGANRYATSQELVLHSFTSASTVYLATGADFPDALTAGGAAGSKGDPLLLVNGGESSVDSGTAAVLKALKPTDIVIVGGTGVVSASLETALRSYGSVSRLSGVDRYGTAAAVDAATYPHASQAFVATGVDFPDALSASVWAGRTASPLYLSPGSCLPDTEESALDALNTSPVTLVGGTGVLTNAMQSIPAC